MLWCCAALTQTPHSVGCAGLECRGRRAQLGNCLSCLPRRRLKDPNYWIQVHRLEHG
ncbi:unnamed protein product, partial [Gulo gulo]